MKNIILTIICLLLVIACDDALTPPLVVEYDGRQSLEAFSVDTVIVLDAFLVASGDILWPMIDAPDGNGKDLFIKDASLYFSAHEPVGFSLRPSACCYWSQWDDEDITYEMIPASGRYYGTEVRDDALANFRTYPVDRDSLLFQVDSTFFGFDTLYLPMCCEEDPILCDECSYTVDDSYHFRGASSQLYYSMTRCTIELLSDTVAVVYFADRGFVSESLPLDVRFRVRIEGYRQNNPNSTWVMP